MKRIQAPSLTRSLLIFVLLFYSYPAGAAKRVLCDARRPQARSVPFMRMVRSRTKRKRKNKYKDERRSPQAYYTTRDVCICFIVQYTYIHICYKTMSSPCRERDSPARSNKDLRHVDFCFHAVSPRDASRDIRIEGVVHPPRLHQLHQLTLARFVSPTPYSFVPESPGESSTPYSQKSRSIYFDKNLFLYSTAPQSSTLCILVPVGFYFYSFFLFLYSPLTNKSLLSDRLRVT